MIRGIGAALHVLRIVWLSSIGLLGAWMVWSRVSGANGYATGTDHIITVLVMAVLGVVALLVVGLVVWLSEGRRAVLIVADSLLLASCLMAPIESFTLIILLAGRLSVEVCLLVALILPAAISLAMLLTVAVDRPKQSGYVPSPWVPYGRWSLTPPGTAHWAPGPPPPEDRP
jgi:hypothetical protein